ncbi:MAG TPA: GldG family protein [Nevskia sp.]|nr:GldG family protein [Nevskia sp.]
MNQKKTKLLQQLLNGLLLTAVIILVGALSVRYKAELDWTAGGRNTLTAASQKLLKQMPDAITFTAFLYPESENRRDIEMWVNRYKRVKPNIELSFVDPSKDPAKVKAYNVDQPGEVVVQYQDRRETLRVLSESAVTGALQRLLDKGDHFVVFIEGHGERSLNPSGVNEEGASQTGYVQFAAALRQKGLKVQGLNLVKTPTIPDNTSVLVVASPTQKLLDGEVKLIDDYVKGGGNLLWLNDPGQPAGLEAVAKTLGITWENGFAVFPDYRQIGSPSPALYLATDYPPNPVTQDMAYVTAFPLARPLTYDQDADRAAGWDVLPLLVTNEASWLETGSPASGTVTFDEKKGDKPGPLTLGITMSRKVNAAPDKDKTGESRTQRIAVVGDSDFLADAYLDQQGNKQLGINLMQWLASRDALLNVDVPKAPDTSLYLPGWATWLVVLGYTIVLPLLLLGYGITRWVRRRRR